VSAVTSKERNMLLITMVLVLYAVAFLFYRKQTENWKKHKRIYQSACEKYDAERDLIAAKDEWDARYREMRSLMPVFPYDKDVDTHWLSLMDSTASANRLSITRRQTGSEEEVGDVFELPVVCSNWEGTLESLVNFLYGLRAEGAMLDVRQLYVRPDAKPGYLKGTFTLYCAYMRGEVVEVPEAASAGQPGAAAEAAQGAPAAPPTAPSVQSAADGALQESAAKPPPVGSGRSVGAGAAPAAGREGRERRGTNLDDGGMEVNEEEAVRAALEALRSARQ
jgi:hypothetical protein